ncbi:glutamate receptor ionotropic, kainate 2 isoform X2 [Exaiptasia diaphana]|uniref:Uncharacterized protein n=1 Tax=Exaiptasia diaphana TaxID=2652724 RepID=A0A913X7L7_EXADI|nr:glutamate receptor ionotropic, kainate 2 isoform X2 [Exaiptasia diaphana]
MGTGTLILQALILFGCFGGVLGTLNRINIVIGVLYRQDYEGLTQMLRILLKHDLTDIHSKILPPQYRLKPVYINVEGKPLLSKEVALTLEKAVCILDMYGNDPDAFALSEMLRLPLITMDSLNNDPPNRFVLSIRPQYPVIAQALFDIILYFKFADVAVLYDVRKTRLASYFYSLARSQDRFGVHLMPEMDLDDRSKTIDALKTLMRSYITNVVLICDHKDMANIMNEALAVGINSPDYRWIASDVEVAQGNKTYYPSILGMVGLSLHVTNKRVSTEYKKFDDLININGGIPVAPVVYAAINDSLYLITRAIKSLITSNRWDSLYPPPTKPYTNMVSCPMKDAKSFKSQNTAGIRLLETMQKIGDHDGLTGVINFDMSATNQRRLDILNIVEKNVEKVGTWNPSPQNDEESVTMKDVNPVQWVGDFADLVKCHNPGKPGKKFVRAKRVLRVTTVIEPPFVEWSNGTILTRPVANTSLQGFCLDLLNELSGMLNLDYQILLRTDNAYGKKVQGRWNGMIGDLVDKKADIALAPITIYATRESVIDFTKPFWDFSMSLIMQKETEEELDLFAFVKPFDGIVWILIIGVVLFVTIMMYIVDLFSPFGHRAEATDTGEGAGDEFNLFNSLWFATASMLQQGGDNTPKSPSGRILAAAFWFFILIIISTYTANLAAFFTIKHSKKTINSLDDLANQDKIKYGVLKGGAIDTFFEDSQLPLYRKMYSQMRQKNSYAPSTSTGVEWARKGGYAYLTEQPYLDYYNMRKPCNTTLLNNLISYKSYGFGLQRNSPYVNELSVAILKLRENGFIDSIKYKWWDERSQCVVEPKSATGQTASLGIQNMAGVFIILLGGVALSFFLIIIEIKCKRLVDLLTKTGQCSKKDTDSYEVNSSENHVEFHPFMSINRPTTLNLPECYANVQESKL